MSPRFTEWFREAVVLHLRPGDKLTQLILKELSLSFLLRLEMIVIRRTQKDKKERRLIYNLFIRLYNQTSLCSYNWTIPCGHRERGVHGSDYTNQNLIMYANRLYIIKNTYKCFHYDTIPSFSKLVKYVDNCHIPTWTLGCKTTGDCKIIKL